MKAATVEKLLFLLLTAGLILSFCTLQYTRMSAWLYPLGLMMAGVAGCIWNWRREPEFTDGFVSCAGLVILSVLLAILFLFIL